MSAIEDHNTVEELCAPIAKKQASDASATPSPSGSPKSRPTTAAAKNSKTPWTMGDFVVPGRNGTIDEVKFLIQQNCLARRYPLPAEEEDNHGNKRLPVFMSGRDIYKWDRDRMQRFLISAGIHEQAAEYIAKDIMVCLQAYRKAHPDEFPKRFTIKRTGLWWWGIRLLQLLLLFYLLFIVYGILYCLVLAAKWCFLLMHGK